MNYDQAQSSRLGQRTPPENPGIRIVTFATLPEVAYKGQIVYLTDLDYILIYDGAAWQAVGDGASGSGSRIFVSATDPALATTVSDGDEWYNTSDQTLKLRHSGTWVDPRLVTGQADGITITGSTFRTAASGQRMQMRDDGSAGILEFFTNLAGETPGSINPQLAGGGVLPSVLFSSPSSTLYGFAARFLLIGGNGPASGATQRTQMYVYPYFVTQGDARIGGTLQIDTGMNNALQPQVSRSRTSDFNTASGGPIPIPYGSGALLDVGMSSGDDINYSCPFDGTYMVVGSVGWDNPSTTGRRQISICVNGTVKFRYAQDASTAAGTNYAQQITGICRVNALDTISIKTFQNSGVNVKVLGDQELTYLSIYMLG